MIVSSVSAASSWFDAPKSVQNFDHESRRRERQKQTGGAIVSSVPMSAPARVPQPKSSCTM